MTTTDQELLFARSTANSCWTTPTLSRMVRAVAKHNCKETLLLNQPRIPHFVQRIADRGMTGADVVIVILSVDDRSGGPLADVFMPGADWQAVRDRGETPFARGLAMRAGIQETLTLIDPEAAEKLAAIVGIAIVVVDYGVAEVWEHNELRQLQ